MKTYSKYETTTETVMRSHRYIYILAYSCVGRLHWAGASHTKLIHELTKKIHMLWLPCYSPYTDYILIPVQKYFLSTNFVTLGKTLFSLHEKYCNLTLDCNEMTFHSALQAKQCGFLAVLCFFNSLQTALNNHFS